MTLVTEEDLDELALFDMRMSRIERRITPASLVVPGLQLQIRARPWLVRARERWDACRKH